MKSRTTKLLLVVAFYAVNLFSNLSYSQDVVCRLPRINGFDREYSVGNSIVGETTSEMSETKIYMTVSDGSLYVHSNYVTPGYDNPTKLATSEEMGSIEDIAMNIFFDQQPSFSEFDRMKSLLKNRVEITLDPAVLKSGKYKTIDFSNAGTMNFICPDGKVRTGIKFRNAAGDIEYLIKYSDQISVRVNGQNLDFIFSQLKSQRINFNDVRIVNLVENSSTKNVLEGNFPGKTLAFDYSSTDNFKNLLLSNKGKRTVVIGHIEDGNFVTIDKSGNEIFRTSISEIEAFQKDNQLELILLGCNSAGEGAGSGALNKFNSIDALNRLKTTEKTKNIEEFLDSLSFRTLHFVVDETFFNFDDAAANMNYQMPKRIDVTVYEHPGENFTRINSSKKKGMIILLGVGAYATLSSVLNPPNEQGDTTGYGSYIDTDKPSPKGNTIFFVIIGIIVVVILAVIFAPSNRT
jgi:hypothetical protein